MRTGFLIGWGLVGGMLAGSTWTMAREPEADFLSEYSLTDLMDVEISTASRMPLSLLDTPAAVGVVTAEDIRRSGATSIPDALRLAPGVTVSRIDLSRWAVSVRGFHGQFAKHLLVLIDGRSVYTPLFSGTTWELQDLMLEDVDRIEVIRGPGAALWGANAVNGVINIITRDSDATQGVLLTLGGGGTERAFGSARYGGSLNDNTTYRVYVKAFERDGFVDEDGMDTQDQWTSVRGGFRIDGEPTAWDEWTLQGDVYNSESEIAARASPFAANPGELLVSDNDNLGGNLIGRWSHVYAEGSRIQLQMYYDRIVRDLSPTFEERRDTVDTELQFHHALNPRHQVVMGGGYRYMHDDDVSGLFIQFDPEEKDTHIANVFIEDEYALVENELFFTAGVKLEHHDYTEYELQPNIRMRYHPADRHTLWASVSRAVRTPSRIEYEGINVVNVEVQDGVPVLWTVFGSDDLDAEELIAYEAGYRALVHDEFTFDAALFYNDYDSLISAEPGPTFPDAGGMSMIRSFRADNKLAGSSYGGEAAVMWYPLEDLRLKLSYGYVQMDLDQIDGGQDIIVINDENKTPRNQAQFWVSLDPCDDVTLDVVTRYVDSIPYLEVPSYITADVRLAWQATRRVEFAVVGQNLLEPQHPEFKGKFLNILQPEIERSAYAYVSVTY